MSLDEMNDKIAVKNPSKDDLNWNEDKTGVKVIIEKSRGEGSLMEQDTIENVS